MDHYMSIDICAYDSDFLIEWAELRRDIWTYIYIHIDIYTYIYQSSTYAFNKCIKMYKNNYLYIHIYITKTWYKSSL